MAQTLPDILINSTSWTNINAASGIPEGTKLFIQNKGVCELLLFESSAQPSLDNKDGIVVQSYSSGGYMAVVQSGSLPIWVLALDSFESRLAIQVA